MALSRHRLPADWHSRFARLRVNDAAGRGPTLERGWGVRSTTLRARWAR